MEHLITEEIIFNDNHNFAILYQVTEDFNIETFLEAAKDKYPKLRFRVYFWIDDAPLNEETIQKFETIFKITGLKKEKFHNGARFLLNLLKFNLEETIIESMRPRQGQDGGVLGFN